MYKYLVTKEEIDELEGTHKVHFLNKQAIRVNKSLGDLTGLTGFGFHIVELAPGNESTEFHKHYFEDECVYILEGAAEAYIGEQRFDVKAGDFLGYRADGEPHIIKNCSKKPVKYIVVGQRLDHDVADYTNLNKRIYRNKGMPWNVIDIDQIETPSSGGK